MNDTYKIRSIGGALLVTVPQKVARMLNLRAGDEVRIRIAGIGQGGVMAVEPIRKPTKGKGK